jgi:glucosamine-6-phosphate deaminase
MKPKIRRHENANSLYYDLVNFLRAEVEGIRARGRDPVLALPTGNTMIPFYRIASEHEEKLGISHWKCFNLDEYYPVTPALIPFSFKTYMEENFYSRLKNPPRVRESMDGMAANFMIECEVYEEKIRKAGGLDIAILGIGVNGHIAFNEPGSEFQSRTRALALHPQTLFANFKGEAPFTHALTLGIGTLLEAKKIVVVALGKSKAQAVAGALREVPSRSLPASALQEHRDVTWFLDEEAASFLS